MTGAGITQAVIYTAGTLVVAIVILLLFSSEGFFPGTAAHGINEDVSLGYQIVNMVNILSVSESGNFTEELVKNHQIQIIALEGKSKLKVGNGEFELLVNVKPTSFITKRGIILSKSEGVIEVLNLV